MALSHKKKNKKQKPQAVEPEDLDRFAGSSEEESESEKEDQEESESEQKQQDKSDSNNESDDESIDEEDEFDDTMTSKKQSLGMAGAMARILGAPVHSSNKSNSMSTVVLSKTTTPLQRQLKKEKELKREQDQKRKLNRQRNLQALHVPLSVATTMNVESKSSNLVQELQEERLYRRVATRGVVALFNAIAQHQQQQQQQQKSETASASTSTATKSSATTPKLTKHGFLDMIKTKAANQQQPQVENKATTNETTIANASDTTKTKKWNAFSDDYMMNSKLKDWDKESSSESEDEQGGSNNEKDDWSDNEQDNNDIADGSPVAKKQRV